jgi:hypothetical protein
VNFVFTEVNGETKLFLMGMIMTVPGLCSFGMGPSPFSPCPDEVEVVTEQRFSLCIESISFIFTDGTGADSTGATAATRFEGTFTSAEDSSGTYGELLAPENAATATCMPDDPPLSLTTRQLAPAGTWTAKKVGTEVNIHTDWCDDAT